MKQILNVSRLYSLSSVYTPSLRASSLRSLFVAHYNVQKRNVEHLAAIKELRKATNGGMAECKEALAKFNWDRDAAIAYIRQRQQGNDYGMDAEKPIYGKVAVPSAISENDSSVIIELNCNCGFITSSKEFITLSQNIRKALQRAVDEGQIAVDYNKTTSSIHDLDIDVCNQAIVDDNEGITVGQLLKRLSGEYKRTIALSGVFLYQKASNVEYLGIYVHKKVHEQDAIIGTRFGMLTLRCNPYAAIPDETVGQSFREIAKALAIQLVANPPKHQEAHINKNVDEGNPPMKQLLEQVWLRGDLVSSSISSICDALGKPKPHIGPEATVYQTLASLKDVLGSDKVYVEDALYMNSGGEVVKFGAHQ